MKQILILLVLVTLTTFSETASARVFNFMGESMAAFFRVNYGLSRVGTKAFGTSSGADTVFAPTPSVPYALGGELGYIFYPAPQFALKFGYEFYQSKKIVAVVGSTAGGTKLFDLTSDIFVTNPNITLEFNFGEMKFSKTIFSLGVGWGNVRVDNAYSFVTAQMGGLGVTANYTENIEQNVINYTASIGYEYLMFDNVTMFLDAGYRLFLANKLTHKTATDIIDLDSGATTASKGATATNNNGSNRGFDMGGYFVGISFRFYINVP